MTRFALCTVALALFTDCSHSRCPAGHVPNDMRQACVATPECDGGALNDSGACVSTQATTTEDGGAAGQNDDGGRVGRPAGSGAGSGGSSGGAAGRDASDGASGHEGMAGNTGSDSGAQPAAPRCGDGTLDPGEKCDGNCETSCPAPMGCVGSALKGSASTCDAECVPTTISTVKDGDGCCPMDATNATDKDCPPRCGDGDLAPDEKCEPGSAEHPCPTVRDCDDGDPCTMDMVSGTAEQCTAQCVHMPMTRAAVSCNDGNPCTDDIMVESTATCSYECMHSMPRTPTGSCVDDNPCTDDTPRMSTTACEVTCPHAPVRAGTPCGDGRMCDASGECTRICGNQAVDRASGEACDRTAGSRDWECTADCTDSGLRLASSYVSRCEQDSDCAEAEACTTSIAYTAYIGRGEKLCFPRCTAGRCALPDGYSTWGSADAVGCTPQSECLVACRADADCPERLRCELTSPDRGGHFCVPL